MKKSLIFIALFAVLVSSLGATSYFVKRANITTASVNIPFGFAARIIMVQADAANAADLCINWEGGTAVCPAANTAGNDRLSAGETLVLDGMGPTVGASRNSISVIADSGTLIFKVRAIR